MEPFVVKVDEEQLDETMVTLLDHDRTKRLRTTNQYEAFRISFAGGIIVGYTSGKIVANTSEGATLLEEVVQGLEVAHSYDILVGSDEAGKGEWLGPLVVSAVAITPTMEQTLRAAGVMDSKMLDSHKLGELAYAIEENCLAIETVLISPEKFNEQFELFHKEGKNLNDILAWAHAKVVSLVMRKIQSKAKDKKVQIIIDEFARAKTDERLQKTLDVSNVDILQVHGAERFIPVAAASIIARDARETWIDRQSGILGIELSDISIDRARKHPQFASFVKVSYVKI